MRTPKIKALNKLIDYLNRMGGEKEKMEKLGLDLSELNSNG